MLDDWFKYHAEFYTVTLHVPLFLYSRAQTPFLAGPPSAACHRVPDFGRHPAICYPEALVIASEARPLCTFNSRQEAYLRSIPWYLPSHSLPVGSSTFRPSTQVLPHGVFLALLVLGIPGRGLLGSGRREKIR